MNGSAERAHCALPKSASLEITKRKVISSSKYQAMLKRLSHSSVNLCLKKFEMHHKLSIFYRKV